MTESTEDAARAAAEKLANLTGLRIRDLMEEQRERQRLDLPDEDEEASASDEDAGTVSRAPSP